MEKTEISVATLQSLDWADGVEGNPKLHDYLCTVLETEPLGIVERNPGNVLEAWQRLAKRFDPTGGQHKIDRYESQVYDIRKAKSLQYPPRMIEEWEKELEALLLEPPIFQFTTS